MIPGEGEFIFWCSSRGHEEDYSNIYHAVYAEAKNLSGYVYHDRAQEILPNSFALKTLCSCAPDDVFQEALHLALRFCEFQCDPEIIRAAAAEAAITADTGLPSLDLPPLDNETVITTDTRLPSLLSLDIEPVIQEPVAARKTEKVCEVAKKRSKLTNALRAAWEGSSNGSFTVHGTTVCASKCTDSLAVPACRKLFDPTDFEFYDCPEESPTIDLPALQKEIDRLYDLQAPGKNQALLESELTFALAFIAPDGKVVEEFANSGNAGRITLKRDPGGHGPFVFKNGTATRGSSGSSGSSGSESDSAESSTKKRKTFSTTHITAAAIDMLVRQEYISPFNVYFFDYNALLNPASNTMVVIACPFELFSSAQFDTLTVGGKATTFVPKIAFNNVAETNTQKRICKSVLKDAFGPLIAEALSPLPKHRREELQRAQIRNKNRIKKPRLDD